MGFNEKNPPAIPEMGVSQEIIQIVQKYYLKNIRSSMRKYFFPGNQIKEIEHVEKLCIRVESDSNRGFWLSTHNFVNK